MKRSEAIAAARAASVRRPGDSATAPSDEQIERMLLAGGAVLESDWPKQVKARFCRITHRQGVDPAHGGELTVARADDEAWATELARCYNLVHRGLICVECAKRAEAARSGAPMCQHCGVRHWPGENTLCPSAG